MGPYEVAEVCAGAGGQALGLEMAGFRHRLAVDSDRDACATLALNRPGWAVAEGDITDPRVWQPAAFAGIDLLAGGVPCQPFSVAGQQLGAADERDLLAWTVEAACSQVRPRALLLENVAGLSRARFAGYRQHVLDRLAAAGYVADWALVNACDYGVPQLRPRFVLVAMRATDFGYFTWPPPQGQPPTVGEALAELMAARGWPGAAAWAARAAAAGPTVVGGSKKHGGPDLGPTRAKRAWRELGVDALGIADAAPPPDAPPDLYPRLTTTMCAVLQGFPVDGEHPWLFAGRKTSVYRQIGNAFPPPAARAVGEQICRALSRQGRPAARRAAAGSIHNPVYAVLRAHGGFLTCTQIARRLGQATAAAIEQSLAHLESDFEVEVQARKNGPPAYRLGRFRAVTGPVPVPSRRPAPAHPPVAGAAVARRAG